MEPTIRRASENDYSVIAHIGRLAVEEAHRASCSVEDMNSFLAANYNDEAIKRELSDKHNIYHLIYLDDQPAGFSKIELNAVHPNIVEQSVTKLDRIYLLREYYDKKLGHALLQFNIEYAQQHGLLGMWLFTWVGNERAVAFYKKAGFVIIGEHKFRVSETHYNPNHHMMLRF